MLAVSLSELSSCQQMGVCASQEGLVDDDKNTVNDDDKAVIKKSCDETAEEETERLRLELRSPPQEAILITIQVRPLGIDMKVPVRPTATRRQLRQLILFAGQLRGLPEFEFAKDEDMDRIVYGDHPGTWNHLAEAGIGYGAVLSVTLEMDRIDRLTSSQRFRRLEMALIAEASEEEGKWQATPIHIAARKNDCDALRVLLLPEHQPQQRQDFYGHTPVWIAAANNSTDALRMLLANGGDRQLCDWRGVSPIDAAKERGALNAIKVLRNEEVALPARVDNEGEEHEGKQDEGEEDDEEEEDEEEDDEEETEYETETASDEDEDEEEDDDVFPRTLQTGPAAATDKEVPFLPPDRT